MGALAALMAASGRGGGMESLSESELVPDGGGFYVGENSMWMMSDRRHKDSWNQICNTCDEP